MNASTGEKFLIVNADDFGMSRDINRAIACAHGEGIVTSASLMVRQGAAAAAADYAAAHPALAVGLHIDLGQWDYVNGEWMGAYERCAGDDEAAVETDRLVAASDDPREIIRLVAEGTGKVRRRRQRALAVLLDNRDADPDVAAAADAALRGIRDRLGVVAARLVEVGGLREGLSRKKVEQILWFYFGIEAWRTARGFGWSWAEAGGWLAEQATQALVSAGVTPR